MYTYQSPLKLILYNHDRLVALVLFCFCVIGGWLFIISPSYQTKIIQQSANLEAQKLLLSDQSAYLTEILALQSSYTGIDDAVLAKVNMAIPATKQYPEMLVQLEGLAESLPGNFILKSINITNGSSGNKELSAMGIKDLNVTLLFEGSSDYTLWKELIKRVENNLRIFDITALNFSPSANKHYLQLRAYYLTPEK